MPTTDRNILNDDDDDDDDDDDVQWFNVHLKCWLEASLAYSTQCQS